MRKLFLLLIAVFLLGFAGSTLIKLEASTSVNYTVTGVFDTGGEWAGLSGSNTRGNSMSFDISSKPSGHDFAFWIVNGVVRKDLPVDHEYTFTTSNELQIVFTPTGKFAAVFIDSNGQYLGVEYTEGGEVLDTGLLSAPARPGYVVASGVDKWTSIEGSLSIADVQENSVFVLTYEEDLGAPISAVIIGVTNGTSSVPNPVPFNSLVTVTADAAPEGQTFAGWYEGDTLVSNNPEYAFTALQHRTLVATYSELVGPSSIVTMSNPLTFRAGHRTYVGQFDLVEGDTLIEYGFLIHPTLEVVDIDFDTPGVVVAQSTNRQTLTNEFVTSFRVGTFHSVRAYAIYNDGVDEVIIYSDKNLQYTTDQVLSYIDFESNTLGSYTTGEVMFGGESWTLTDSLIGTSTSDSKFGAKSLRIRNGGIQSTDYYENGVGTIRFHYANYGADQDSHIKVQYAYAWDNQTWTDAATVGVASTQLNVAEVDVNISVAIHIRIIREGTSGHRINIDNIIVNYQDYVDDVGPEIDGTQNFTITEGDDLTPLTGVTARDIIEGDLTSEITYTVYDSEEEIIDPVDFTALVAGTYTIEYSVKDTNDNLTTKTVTLTIETAPDPEDPLLYSTTFEASEGFTAGTVYNNTTIKMDGPEGKKWGTYYGTASTTSAIEGSMSMQMRWYTGGPNGYTFTDFYTNGVGKIEFLASKTSNINVIVEVSTNGTDWLFPETFTLTTSAVDYTYNVDSSLHETPIMVKFTITYTTTPANAARLYIDNVRFSIPE